MTTSARAARHAGNALAPATYRKAVQIQEYVHSIFGAGYFVGWGAHLRAMRGTTPRAQIDAELRQYRANRARQTAKELREHGRK